MSAKLREHYGIDVPVSTVRALTEHHGATMRARQPQRSPWPEEPGVSVLIAEMDGSMVPRVETAVPGDDEVPRDRRKTTTAELDGGPPVSGAGTGLGDARVWRHDGERG